MKKKEWMIADIEWNRSYRQGIAYATKCSRSFSASPPANPSPAMALAWLSVRKLYLITRVIYMPQASKGRGQSFAYSYPW